VNTNSGEEAEHLRQWGAKTLHHATEKKRLYRTHDTAFMELFTERKLER